MAQWSGQFTGNTHETKVQDIEVTLRNAVTALKKSNNDDKEHKSKLVSKLSARLLSARLKMLKVRLSDLTRGRHSEEIFAGLKIRINNIEQSGIEGILEEFGVLELISAKNDPSNRQLKKEI